jgi:hypothetical protein
MTSTCYLSFRQNFEFACQISWICFFVYGAVVAVRALRSVETASKTLLADSKLNLLHLTVYGILLRLALVQFAH